MYFLLNYKFVEVSQEDIFLTDISFTAIWEKYYQIPLAAIDTGFLAQLKMFQELGLLYFCKNFILMTNSLLDLW